MKVVVAFDSFKGCMTSVEACETAALAIRSCRPDAEVISMPLSDGGEGLSSCIARALSLPMVTVKVHGPLMDMVEARYAISTDGTTAYMEMAEASGLTLVPADKRNPMQTTTYGVGEMILDAAGRGCKHIVMGIGGSATCDGGRGMVDCLRSHLPLPVEVTVASDVDNPLYGENGAAYVFAPQKGATPEQVQLLDERLRRFADETVRLGIASPSLSSHPGAGAAGGLGYALMAYLGATLKSGIDLVLSIVRFEEALTDADLVITGEGCSDRQTLMGKVPMGVLRKARKHDVSVALLSGAIHDRETLLRAGFSHVASVNEGDNRPLHVLMQLDTATTNIKNTIEKLLKSK